MKKKKRTKLARMLVAVLATVCLLSSAISVSAAVTNDNTLTITGISGAVTHTFDLYQIMVGEYAVGAPSDMKWGTGISQYDSAAVTSGGIVDPVVLFEIAEMTDAKSKEFISKIILSETKTTKTSTADGTVIFPSLTTGYYLVKDVTASLSGHDSISGDVLVYVSGAKNIAVKSVKPEFGKQVSKNGSGEWAEVVDSNIGDTVHYKLTVTLPASEHFASYPSYQLKIVDALSDGVSYMGVDSVTYKVGEAEAVVIPAYSEETANGYKLTQTSATENAKAKLEISFDDLIQTVTAENWGEAMELEVIYSARMNEKASSINASVSDEGYTTGKISAGAGYLEYSNNPAQPEVLGQTAEDTVGVFTFRMENTKYANLAQAGYELNGAKFTLHKESETGEVISMIYDGTLQAYRPTVEGESAVANMVSGYGLTEGDLNGKLDIAGLSAGTYVLVEDEAPSGYTKIEPKSFTITVNMTEKEDGQAASAAVTLTGIDSLTGNQIIDTLTSNSQLPSTGGIGTTIFYIVGSLMVCCAGIVLITRKRMNYNR